MAKELQVVTCRAENCDGVVKYNEDVGEFLCGKCGALHTWQE